MNPYILESVSSGEYFKCIYMAAPFSKIKKAKNGTFGRQTIGATNLKLGLGLVSTWPHLPIGVCN